MEALETPNIRTDGIDQDRATLAVVLEDCAGEPPGVDGQVGEGYDRGSGDEVGGWRQVELSLGLTIISRVRSRPWLTWSGGRGRSWSRLQWR